MLKIAQTKVLLISFLVMTNLHIGLFSMEATDERELDARIESPLDGLEQEQYRIANRLLASFRLISYNDGLHTSQDHQLYKDEHILEEVFFANDRNIIGIARFSDRLGEEERDRADESIVELTEIQENINSLLELLQTSDVGLDVKDADIGRLSDLAITLEEQFLIRGKGIGLTEEPNICAHVYEGPAVPLAIIRDAKHCPFCEDPGSIYRRNDLPDPVVPGGHNFWTAKKIAIGATCIALVVLFTVKTFFWK